MEEWEMINPTHPQLIHHVCALCVWLVTWANFTPSCNMYLWSGFAACKWSNIMHIVAHIVLCCMREVT
jgi:hypothetical protein